MVRTKGSRNPVDYRISWEMRLPHVRTNAEISPSQTGQAVVTLNGHDHYLGKWNTAASRKKYDRLIAEWLAHGRRRPASQAAMSALSVNEVLLAYWQHVETYYRLADGTVSTEVDNIRPALRPLRALYGHTSAANFDAPALEMVREEMIHNGRCRNRVNKDVARIKRLFKWAASKKLAPVSVYQDLDTIEGLRAGRSKAKETQPVQPVPRAIVEQTLTVMRRTLADMVRLQLEIGMRPGEVCAMRAIDIDMTGPVWLYRPGRHKTEQTDSCSWIKKRIICCQLRHGNRYFGQRSKG
jgi:integrase